MLLHRIQQCQWSGGHSPVPHRQTSRVEAKIPSLFEPLSTLRTFAKFYTCSLPLFNFPPGCALRMLIFEAQSRAEQGSGKKRKRKLLACSGHRRTGRTGGNVGCVSEWCPIVPTFHSAQPVMQRGFASSFLPRSVLSTFPKPPKKVRKK